MYTLKLPQSLTVEVKFHPDPPVSSPHTYNTPMLAGPRKMTAAEKAAEIAAAKAVGFSVGATVVRKHHADQWKNGKPVMESCVGTIIKHNTDDPHWQRFTPLSVQWDNPKKGFTSFSYAVEDLDLYPYEWKDQVTA